MTEVVGGTWLALAVVLPPAEVLGAGWAGAAEIFPVIR